MEYTFQCSNVPPQELIEELVNRCFTLEPNEHLVVFDFGEDLDLRLDIYKDEDYDGNEANIIWSGYTQAISRLTAACRM